MERSELIELLIELRKRLVRMFLIFAIASAVFFTFGANFVVGKIVEDLYPSEAIVQNREKLLTVSRELANVSEVLRNYALYPSEHNRTLALQAAKNLTRIASLVASMPILKSPLEGLMLNLKISTLVGVAAVLPYLLKVVCEVARERGVNVAARSAVSYAIAAAALYAIGVAYGYFMMKFFLRFLYSLAEQQGAVPLYSLSEFVSFVFLMFAIFGFVFVTPVLMLFLVRQNIVKLETLLYYRRHIYVLFFVIGAVVTPPDVFTQLMVAIPLVVFFEISLLVIRLLS
ncbi:MAG: twin-arginine translocase subunit TatC [Archaeoglobaceae archaeon]